MLKRYAVYQYDSIYPDNQTKTIVAFFMMEVDAEIFINSHYMKPYMFYKEVEIANWDYDV